VYGHSIEDNLNSTFNLANNIDVCKYLIGTLMVQVDITVLRHGMTLICIGTPDGKPYHHQLNDHSSHSQIM